MNLTLKSIRARCSMRCGCLIWNGAVSGDGYPFAYLPEKRNMTNARRWVWMKVNGPIPAGRVVVMTCRERLCLEPEHMALMTSGGARTFAAAVGAFETTACKVARIANGRKRSKLDIPTADVIRVRVAAGERRASLAAEHGVDTSVIDRIVSGKRYTRVMAPNASVFHQAA